MFFTQEDYRKIEKWLLANSRKDTNFVGAATPLKGNETVVLVQNGKNVKTSVKDIVDQFFLLGVSDFLNITDKYGESYISINQAIQLIPFRSRKIGQVITFIDEYGNWAIYQFQGKALNQWNNTTLWIDLLAKISGIPIIDSEDIITKVDDANQVSLYLADKQYNEADYSGLGRIYLRKNIQTIIDPSTEAVINVNLLTQSMLAKENTIYIIQYDYNLNNQTITIPEGCILDMRGGSVTNGTINCVDTIIISTDASKLNVTLTGTYRFDSEKLVTLNTEDINISQSVDRKSHTISAMLADRDTTNGMGYVILRKDKSFKEQVTQENTIYEIRYDFTLNENITIPANCILQFEGGSIANATGNEYQINFNNGCYIDAPESAVIFKDVVFTPMNVAGGVLKNTTIYPAWFGCTVGSDLVQTLPAVMACAYAIGVHNIQFSSGSYLISDEVVIGGTELVNFDLNIKGNGCGLYGGTLFSYTSSTARLKIDMTESNYGIERTFHISDIAFDGYNKENNALMVTQGMCCSIERCRFRYCNIAIKFVNSTYLTKVDSCIFNDCNNGIYADNDPVSPDYTGNGQTNNNMIINCSFAYCSTTSIDLHLGDTNGWIIIGGDWEGGNGTLNLGSRNMLVNARLERNLDTLPYLRMNNNCTVIGTAIHTVGGSPYWRVIVEGDNNNIQLQFIGFSPKGILSYGKGNQFDISIPSSINQRVLNLFDEDDIFILNGYSNKEEYLSEGNLFVTSPRGDDANKLIQKGSKQYKSFSNRVNQLTVKNNVRYVTGSIYSYDSSLGDVMKTIALFSDGLPVINIDKWFAFNVTFGTAVGSDAFSLFFIVDSASSATYKETIINMTASLNIPIYNRPCVGESSSHDDYAYYDKNGNIQLVNTYLNYQYMDFGLVTNKRQILKTPFGKKFYHNGTNYLDMENNILQAASSGAGLMTGIPYAKIEVFDLNSIDGYLNGEIIFKEDASDTPDVVTKNSKILSFGDKNVIGTVDIIGSNNYIVYKTIITPYKGLASYNASYNKPVWYDGTDWVDATGATV